MYPETTANPTWNFSINPKKKLIRTIEKYDKNGIYAGKEVITEEEIIEPAWSYFYAGILNEDENSYKCTGFWNLLDYNGCTCGACKCGDSAHDMEVKDIPNLNNLISYE